MLYDATHSCIAASVLTRGLPVPAQPPTREGWRGCFKWETLLQLGSTYDPMHPLRFDPMPPQRNARY
eukprot:3312514-Rhodomonas_salina.1